jgi:hypothetical protein
MYIQRFLDKKSASGIAKDTFFVFVFAKIKDIAKFFSSGLRFCGECCLYFVIWKFEFRFVGRLKCLRLIDLCTKQSQFVIASNPNYRPTCGPQHCQFSIAPTRRFQSPHNRTHHHTCPSAANCIGV